MIGCEYCLSVKLQLKIKDFNKTCFVQSDFIKTFRGVDQQHKKVVIHKFFMSIERIDAKCVNRNMMPAAELQQTEKNHKYLFIFFYCDHCRCYCSRYRVYRQENDFSSVCLNL